MLDPIELDPIAKHVTGEAMCFLNTSGIAGRHGKKMVGNGCHFAAALPGEGNGDEALRACKFKRGDHVGTVTGCRDADQDIARRTERLHLAGEDSFVAVIVSDGREDGRIGGERDGWQAPALAAVTANDLSCKVLGVGGTASIAAPEDLVAGKKC